MSAPPAHAAAAAPAADPLATAHASVVADQHLQFHFTQTAPPPAPPNWLEPFARFMSAIAPVLVYVFWIGVAIIVAIILYALVSEILRRMPKRGTKPEAPAPIPKPVYRPNAARARALLEEADRLAAEGRYAEAARVLLHRSIEDFETVFQMTIGPALTSREITRLDRLSPQGRSVFSGIADAVETSLFGEQPLGRESYAQCREAYSDFALKGAQR